MFSRFSLCFMGVFLFFFTACSDSQNEVIRAKSSGVIEYQQNLFIEFDEKFTQNNSLTRFLSQNNGIIKAKVNGKEADIKAFAQGETLKLDLTLKPKSTYKLEFKVYDLPVKLEFKTVALKISTPNVSFLDDGTQSALKLTFDSSFDLDEESIKGISLRKDGQKLRIESFDKNDKVFIVTSEKFALTEKNQKIIATFNAKILGLEKDLKFEYLSNAKGELSLQSVRSEERGIWLNFSAELDSKQRVKDFISIKPKIEFNTAIVGNTIKLVGNFSRTQSYTVSVMKGIKAKSGIKSLREFSGEVSFSDLEPSLAFSSDGVFLPNVAEKKIAFKSLNVKKIKLKIYQIYANNLSEYLRENNFQARKKMSSAESELLNSYFIEYTADLILEKEFDVANTKNQWVQNEIALNAIKDLSGVFIVSLSFDKDGTDYDFSNYESYQVRNFFYRRAEVSKHLIFSNLALSADAINDEIYVNVRDFINLQAQSGVKVEAINKKNQVIASAISDNNGDAILNVSRDKTFFLVASKDNQASILKLNAPLSTDGFDVDGLMSSGKIKAFIYSDRGVYRPGDDIHFNVVAKNEKGAITHPINLSIKDSKGKVIEQSSLQALSDGMFYKKITLDKVAPTGVYEATLDIGSHLFHHKILVQTVAPNRIEVNLNADEFIDIKKNKLLAYTISSKYLFGTPASGLEANTNLKISKKKYLNSKFNNYIFENPSLYIPSRYDDNEGTLDENGVLKAHFTLSEEILNSEGVNFNAFLNAEVFEQGGRSTKNVLNVELRKYDYFVGIKKLESKYISSNSKISFDVIVSDLKEKLIKGKKLEYKIYQNNYSWWWDYDNYGEFLRSIKKDKNSQIIKTGEITSDDKPVRVEFLPEQNYGDMFIEIIDKQSGVSTGQNFYISSWGEPSTADIHSALKIKSDKESYKVGEKAKIEFESVKGGKALIALSNNSGVIKRFSIDTKGQKTEFEVPIEKNFAPNIYVSVSFIQEYKNWENDRALRLFGVIPLNVNDEQSKITLNLNVPDKILPQSEFEVSLQSADKKPYTYTLAVVDEGLLNLTNFQTPNIWGYFYAKMGFKLKVFDTYDKIIAKSFGAVAKVLQTGGDALYSVSKAERANKSKEDEQAKRFNPVVLYQAPVKTDKNGFAKLKFTMPSYMGSLRVMAVASNGEAFGSAEKNVLVSAPVIMLETLPRALRIGDEFKLLVQVFKVDENVKNATISLKNKNGLLKFDKNEIKIDFSKNQKQDVYFNVKVNDDKIGIEELEFKLQADKYTYNSKSEIDIKAKNAYTYESQSTIIKANESKEFSIESGYVKSSTTATLKISPTPILNLDKRLQFLIRYPYGCIEQTTSAVLPQLYLDKFSYKANKQKIINNINAAISRYERFQTADGGFAYWQGGKTSDVWGSNYAGMFLLMAKEAGYFVPQNLYNRWLEYEKNYVKKSTNKNELFNKANSLFLLALAKEPNISAMNALYESKDELDTASLWQLAAAYKLAGIDDIAMKIASSTSIEPNLKEEDYRFNYGSVVRDKAIISNAYGIIYGKNNTELLEYLSATLQADSYLSTQSSGYALYALALALNLGKTEQGEAMNASVKIDGKNTELKEKSLQSFEFNEGKALVQSKKDVFVSFGVEGIKLDIAEPFSKNIEVTRTFFDEKGNEISEDKIKSSQTFYMRLSVAQAGNFGRIDNVALTQVLPSGWEVANTILGDEMPSFARNSFFDFVDVRDDKIMWFFSLYEDEIQNFYIKLNAVTPGKYSLTGAFVEAMYDDSFQALSEGKTIIVEQ